MAHSLPPHNRGPLESVVGIAQQRLRESPYGALHRVTCQCNDGEDELTLSGTVPSYYLKQIAQVTVGDLPGVHVDNQIVVAK